ncbi:hypothetical protein BH11PLA1_BH11PLA1_17080 [soil metagenome]
MVGRAGESVNSSALPKTGSGRAISLDSLQINPTSEFTVSQNRLFRTLALAASAGAAFSCTSAFAVGAEGASPLSARRGVVTPPSPTLNHVMTRTALLSADPSTAMSRLRWNLELSKSCYDENADPAILALDLQKYGLRPVAEGPLGENNGQFFNTGFAWLGNVPFSTTAVGSSTRAARTDLRYSFPADGVTWGTAGSGSGPNNLNVTLTNLYGVNNLDQGREYIRQAFASWRRHGGITYTEVSDNNASFTTTTTKSTSFGEIRVGGVPLGGPGVTSVLAYDLFPDGGGDMTINTSYFLTLGSAFANSNNNYRYFRNVVAHEHGHGLGYQHVIPCSASKLMEPQISTSFDMLSVDEKRAAGRNYGDRFSGNSTAALARDFGNLTAPTLRSVIYRDLSTNGSTGINNTNQDWFKFTLGTDEPVVVTVTPTGGSYLNDTQTSGCNNPASPTTVNATSAGNLTVRIWNFNGTVLMGESAVGAAGVAEVLPADLTSGTYCIQVIDVGPSSNQLVQLYDLTLRVAGALAPPDPIAGVNKRIQAGASCFFDGRPNSKVSETGASVSRYDWDLDNDGVFEIQNNGAPVRIYSSNGVIPVTLKVTDTNGLTANDTINVTVYGATTFVSLVSPNAGQVGADVSVVLLVTNALGVTSPAQVQVTGGSGPAITVTGTPIIKNAGTRIEGLTFHVPAGASLGGRTVALLNSDGAGATGSASNAFTVNPAPVLCPPDIADDAGNAPPIGGNSGVNEGDYNAFFNLFFTNQAIGSPADIADDAGNPLPSGESNSGVNEGDYNLFFNDFFTGC